MATIGDIVLQMMAKSMREIRTNKVINCLISEKLSKRYICLADERKEG